MEARRQLGDFLQSRRGQLRPEDLGLAVYGDQRRVPGLRREELAMLAGVSASYYARLEQGLSSNASPQVLDSIAQALRLNEAERRHLHALAAGTSHRATTVRRAAPERPSAAVRQLLDALTDVPAIVLGRRSDVLAWNRAGHALYAGHLDPNGPEEPERRPNMARLVFLDAHTRELYEDWPTKARAVVGSLRLASGRHPDDPALGALIGELSVHSAEFATWWAAHPVKSGATADYRMRHPSVGAMTVTQQTLHIDQDQHIVVATAQPGSASHAAMTLLLHAAATSGPGPADHAARAQPNLDSLPVPTSPSAQPASGEPHPAIQPGGEAGLE